MAEAVEARDPVSLPGPSSRDLDVEADERRAEEQRKRTRDPPVVYRDIDVSLHTFGISDHIMYTNSIDFLSTAVP